MGTKCPYIGENVVSAVTTIKPTSSTCLASDWDDDELDSVLTQMIITDDPRRQRSLESGQQPQPQPQQRRPLPHIVVKEMTRIPQRTFSPSSINRSLSMDHAIAVAHQLFFDDRATTANGKHDGASQSDSASQIQIAIYQKEIERLKQELLTKEGEIKVIRDVKNEFERQVSTLKSELSSHEQQFNKRMSELDAWHNAEKEKLRTEKQFMEKENRDLEQALQLEKNFHINSNDNSEYERQLIYAADSENSSVKNGVVTRRSGNFQKNEENRYKLERTSLSQFPNLRNFYASTSTSENGIKRRKLSSRFDSFSITDESNKPQNIVTTTLVVRDQCTQTDSLGKRKIFDLRRYATEKHCRFWYVPAK